MSGRIRGVEALALEIPLTKNFGGSTYNVLTRCTIVTRLATEDGLVSQVYNGDNRDDGRTIVKLIHEELAPAYELLAVTTGPIQIKAALNLIGQDVGGLRLPLVEASDEERAQIRDCLERLGVLQQASV